MAELKFFLGVLFCEGSKATPVFKKIHVKMFFNPLLYSGVVLYISKNFP